MGIWYHWWCLYTLGKAHLVVIVIKHRVVDPEEAFTKDPERVVDQIGQVGGADVHGAVATLVVL